MITHRRGIFPILRMIYTTDRVSKTTRHLSVCVVTRTAKSSLLLLFYVQVVLPRITFGFHGWRYAKLQLCFLVFTLSRSRHCSHRVTGGDNEYLNMRQRTQNGPTPPSWRVETIPPAGCRHHEQQRNDRLRHTGEGTEHKPCFTRTARFSHTPAIFNALTAGITADIVIAMMRFFWCTKRRKEVERGNVKLTPTSVRAWRPQLAAVGGLLPPNHQQC